MILVLASALAFGLLRTLWNQTLRNAPTWGRFLAYDMVGHLALTPTLLAMRLIRPRPSLRELCRRPGFVATLAGTSILALAGLAMLLIGLFRGINRRFLGPRSQFGLGDPDWWINVLFHFGIEIGPAVIAAWIVLALSGRRRPGRDGFDYAGRMIGVGWIVLFVLNAALRLAYFAQ